ncbi:MAG: lipid-A-disaccharide synthase [Desulfobacterota bacterium]|nr:lipid-A-disaccharide synthase [Thermodesulfobacteriota bacterium]
MKTGQKKILVIAGETSGDHHASLVLRELKRIDPSVAVAGIGGDELSAAGMTLLYHCRELAVVGLSEVAARLRHILRAYWIIRRELDKKPALLMLVDYPEFNLMVAACARKRHVPVLYYISPQVWAWRRGRARKIAARVDRMAVIFPFEVALYEPYGLTAQFVGHPLLDQSIEHLPREQALQRLGFRDRRPIIGLLPGSRQAEIDRLFGPMLGAATRIQSRFPDAQFIVPVAPGISAAALQARADAAGVAVRVVESMFYQSIAVCDLVLVASGTATLQTALMHKPMVILYRVSPLTYLAGRLLIRIPWIGLANILAGKLVVPELIQHRVTSQNIADEACSLLGNPERMKTIEEELAAVAKKLGSPGASRRVAEMAYEMIT